MNAKPLTLGSLFTGFGGLDLGLERAGFRVKFQVEKEPSARRVLEDRWPGVPRPEDVHDVPVDRSELWDVDLLAGGDPCQENSKCRVGRTTSHPSLGGEFIRIIGELRPKLVLRENPVGMHPDAPWPWWRFRDELRGLGYLVLPFRLRACCLGLDHRRERMFLLASLPDPHGVNVQPLQERRFAASPDRPHQGEAEEQRIWPESGPVLPAERRRDDRRVAGRLDGLPKGVGERVLRGYGNAVPPAMGEFIGRRLIEFDAEWRAAVGAGEASA